MKNMRWDYLFSAQILARGREYFRRGKVKELIHRGATYQAKVIGTETYRVEAYLVDRVHPRLYCDCRYAEDGYYCKHMAAVLFAIDEEEKTGAVRGMPGEGAQKRPVRIYPFSKAAAANAAATASSTTVTTALPDTTGSAAVPADGTTSSAAPTNGSTGTPVAAPAGAVDVPAAPTKSSVGQQGAQGLQDDYEYFDLERMTKNFVFYDNVCREAEGLLAAGTVELTQVQTGYPNLVGANELIGVAEGVFRQKTSRGAEMESSLTVRFSKQEFFEAECQTPKCLCCYNEETSMYYSFSYRKQDFEPCAHLTALLMLLQRKLRAEAIGDATDSYAKQLLLDFRHLRTWADIQQRPELASEVSMEPVLTKEREGLLLGFRIGTNKLYQVKSLPELVWCVEEKGELTLGTKTRLDFASARIRTEAERYYDFLRSVVLGERCRQEYGEGWSAYYADSMAENIKGTLRLYGKRLDDFFEIANGQTISFNDRSGYEKVKTTLKLRETPLKTVLTISREMDENSVFQGVRLRGEIPELMQGVDHAYFLSEDCLNRVNADSMEKLRPVLELVEDGRISVQIGRRYLSEFYYRVLPVLRDCAEVKEKDVRTIRRYLPPEAEFVFYLDAEKKDASCQVRARYGEVECDVLDWLRQDVLKERFRDGEREREVLACVRDIFPEFDAEKAQLHCGEDTDRVYRLLDSGVSKLLGLGEVQSTEAFRKLHIRKSIPVSIGVSIESGLLELEISSTELTQDELLEILQQYQRKKKFFRLRNGDFLKLEEQGLEELANLLEAAHISPKEFVRGKMELPLYRAFYLDKMLERCEGVYTDRDSHFKELVKNFKTIEDSDYVIPQELRKILRKYQKYGFRWLRTLAGCGLGGILADDMGLGKTLQVIAVLLAANKEGVKDPALVVTPASLVYNWQEEFAQFAPQLRVGVIVGNQTQRQELLESYRQWDVLITSYDLLKRDVAEYEDKRFSCEVIDEAQYIKNHATAAAKSVKVIHSSVRYALTGTPIENRLSELWSIFDYLMPGFLYSYEVFKRELETPIVKNKDAAATERLKRMVSPFILRRLKKDVLKDLPDKLEEVYYAKMEETQRQLYDAQVVHMKKLLKGQSDESFRRNKLQVLAEITKLRQICCDPSLFLENYSGQSAKRETCMELIQSAVEGEHKLLLFSQFTSMLALLEQELTAKGIPYYKITGETPKEQRMELVRRFNQDSTPVFLISLKAGGTGLNLTGADIVIHYDPWWNLAVQNQATDRAHRIGQTKVVSVYKLIVKNSIEERILRMQEEKKNLADEILNGETNGLVNMSREELLELL